MRMPLVTEIQRFSLQDGPGIRTTVFVKGCPLKCPWRHNPETQSPEADYYYYEDKCTACGHCVEVCPTGASKLIVGGGNDARIVIDREACIRCLKCVETCGNSAREGIGGLVETGAMLDELLSDELFYRNSGGGVTIGGMTGVGQEKQVRCAPNGRADFVAV